MFKAGAAQIEITPDLPFPRGGGPNTDRVIDTYSDPMLASALALESAGESLLFVSCDICLIKEDVADELRTCIQAETGVARERVFISATHNHQSPRFASVLPAPWETPDLRIRHKVCDRIVEAARQACSNLRPAKLGFRKGAVDNCAFNRRYIMNDGRVKTNPGANPGRLMVEGPADNDVHALWFEDERGELIAVAVHFTAHPQTMSATSLASADYPGAVRETIQRIFGADLPVLFLQGAAGNQFTIDLNQPGYGRGNEWRLRLGRMIGAEAVRLVASRSAWDSDPGLTVKSEIVPVPYREFTAEQVREAELRWSMWTDSEKYDPRLGWDTYHTYSLIELNRRKQAQPYVAAEVSAIGLGGVTLLTFPGELFVEYQLELKARLADLHRSLAVVVGYTNGFVGYIPTPQAFALGGYETELALASKLAPEAGRLLTDRSWQLAESIHR
jgi:hypothetical protein